MYIQRLNFDSCTNYKGMESYKMALWNKNSSATHHQARQHLICLCHQILPMLLVATYALVTASHHPQEQLVMIDHS